MFRRFVGDSRSGRNTGIISTCRGQLYLRCWSPSFWTGLCKRSERRRHFTAMPPDRLVAQVLPGGAARQTDSLRGVPASITTASVRFLSRILCRTTSRMGTSNRKRKRRRMGLCRRSSFRRHRHLLYPRRRSSRFRSLRIQARSRCYRRPYLFWPTESDWKLGGFCSRQAICLTALAVSSA